MKKVKVLSVVIDAVTKEELLILLKEKVSGSGQLKIAKVNSEFLLRAKNDAEFEKTLDAFDLKIADGIGVLWAAKYLSIPLSKIPVLRQFQAFGQMIYSGASVIFWPKYVRSIIPETIPGVEALKLTLRAAERKGESVFIFGAKPEILKDAVNLICDTYPKLKIAGVHDGYSFSEKEIIGEIKESRASVLIVALGSPKQEYWIRDHLTELPNIRIAIGEGGSLDRIARPKRLAPSWVNKVGLEWLWRSFSSPNLTETEGHRLKRVWNAVPVFIAHVVKYKLEK